MKGIYQFYLMQLQGGSFHVGIFYKPYMSSKCFLCTHEIPLLLTPLLGHFFWVQVVLNIKGYPTTRPPPLYNPGQLRQIKGEPGQGWCTGGGSGDLNPKSLNPRP